MNARAQGRQIDDEALQAYIDGRLVGDDGAAFAAWLDTNPEAAARVKAHAELRATMREALESKAQESIPPRLRIESILAARQATSRTKRLRIAAAVALLFAGATAGWGANEWLSPQSLGRMTAAPEPLLTAEATAAHRIFAAEVRHPVEVDAAEEAHLVGWLSSRLGRPLRAPDLRAVGFSLLGGRLLSSTAVGPAAQLMYEDRGGQRLTVYLRGADSGTTDPTGQGQTAFQFTVEGGISALWWVDRGFAFVVSGEADRQTLSRAAEVVYHQLSARGA